MKRRWGQLLLAVVMLLITLVTAGLWVRSHWTADRLNLIHYLEPDHADYLERRLAIVNQEGCVVVGYSSYGEVPGRRVLVDRPRSNPMIAYETGPAVSLSWINRWGLGWVTSSWTDRVEASQATTLHWNASIPHWLVICVFGGWPAIWLCRRWRARRRVREGCCRVCGYDLRATPERCPECGTVAAGGSR